MPSTDQSLKSRQRVARTVDAALVAGGRISDDADELQDAEPDAEAVMRSAFLVQAVRRKQLPDWVAV
jgi:hypothetical protein